MTKTLLAVPLVFLLAACKHTTPPKPDADRVIKDTIAENILKPFNEAPHTAGIYVQVHAKEDKIPSPRNAAVKMMMAGLKPAPQLFVIDNTQTADVMGREGTRLTFEPNGFVGSDGDAVSGPVTIELKECYNLEAMLAENMQSAAGSALAASRGMICVNAYAGGKELCLKPGKAVHVLFPFETAGYTLYHGDEDADGLIAWGAKALQPQSEKVFASGGFSTPGFNDNGLDIKHYLLQNLAYPDEARRNELSDKVEVTFELSKEGKATDIITSETYKIFRQAIADALKDMPDWQPAVYRGAGVPSSVHLTIDFNIRSASQVQVDYSADKASLISNGSSVYVLCGADFAEMRMRNQPGLALNCMGWFNYSKPVAVHDKSAEVIVCADDKSEVKLLLKKHHAIAGAENHPGFADFKNLPAGEEAWVVATRCDKGKMFYAYQQVKLSRQSVVKLKWQNADKRTLAKLYHHIDREFS